MIRSDSRQRIINDLSADFSGCQTCFFVTLNALTKDSIKLDQCVIDLIYWLNRFCFGRSFISSGKRLKAAGVTEVGTANQGLHMHLVMGHRNDTDRTTEEIAQFIKRKWYALLNAKSKRSKPNYGSLVDLKFAYDVKGCFVYLTKTIYRQSTLSNPQYF
jgi:hypothetical protein